MNPSDPTRPGRLWRALIALCIGLLIGCFFHYLLYRFSLPAKPFIYVAF
jgi:hypothetical protein